MAWSHCFEFEDFPFVVHVDSLDIVGFNIRDDRIIRAIRTRDERIFDLLNRMVDEIDVISLSNWAGDWMMLREWRDLKSLDELERDYIKILGSDYADSLTKEAVKKELDWVAQQRQRQKEGKVKKVLLYCRHTYFGQIRDQLMLALIERDGYRCAICGIIQDLTIDHIVPLSKGGADNLDNLRLLCRRHNSSKGDKLNEDLRVI